MCMEDYEIIDLFLSRSENAITETAQKYGPYCKRIAMNLLSNHQDVEECVSDTYLHIWNAIPPVKPTSFLAYLGRTVRNISIDCYKRQHTQKRGGGETPLLLSELADCIPHTSTMEQELEDRQIAAVISSFLRGRKEPDRLMFVRRYWYGESIREIAEHFGVGEETVKSSIFRTRKKLKAYLEQEGITL